MKNPYESGTQKVIPAVLLYAFHGNELLMLNAKGKDGMPGKWNGLGGKLELGERPHASLQKLSGVGLANFHFQISRPISLRIGGSMSS